MMASSKDGVDGQQHTRAIRRRWRRRLLGAVANRRWIANSWAAGRLIHI